MLAQPAREMIKHSARNDRIIRAIICGGALYAPVVVGNLKFYRFSSAPQPALLQIEVIETCARIEHAAQVGGVLTQHPQSLYIEIRLRRSRRAFRPILGAEEGNKTREEA
jgi:hypothetical protein